MEPTHLSARETRAADLAARVLEGPQAQRSHRQFITSLHHNSPGTFRCFFPRPSVSLYREADPTHAMGAAPLSITTTCLLRRINFLLPIPLKDILQSGSDGVSKWH